MALTSLHVKPCPVKDCPWFINQRALMCAYHWRFVDKPLALALHRWSQFNRHAPEYRELCGQAITAAARAPQPHSYRVRPPESDPDICPF
jgi:hypothetical protein